MAPPDLTDLDARRAAERRAPLTAGVDVLVLNGPNLNMLGLREPEIYGSSTLSDLEDRCADAAAAHGLSVACRQSNHEGDLVDWIQAARERAGGLVLNAGAYTHTSIALRDALAAAEKPCVEVHLSNIHAREPERRVSHVAPVAIGVIAGFGVDGYAYAIDALARRIGGAERTGA